MKKIIEIIIRLIVFPFIAVIVLVYYVKIYLTVMVGYLIYGGETIMYSQKLNKKQIYNVFLEVQKMIEENNNKTI